MTHPGDPGYASASRQAHTASVAEVAGDDTADGLDGPESVGLDAVYATDDDERDVTDAPSRRRPWTLRRRLLVIVAALLVAVSAVIGIATVLVFHTSSVERQIGRASCRERVL